MFANVPVNKLITARAKLGQLKKLPQSSPENFYIYISPRSHFHWPVSSNPKTALEAGEVPTESSQPICSVYAKHPKCKTDCSYSALCVTITSAAVTLATQWWSRCQNRASLKRRGSLSGIVLSYILRVFTKFVSTV